MAHVINSTQFCTFSGPLRHRITREWLCQRSSVTTSKRGLICHSQTVNTFSKVLGVVVIDLAQAPISFDHVVLGAAQVDLTVLKSVTRTQTNKQREVHRPLKIQVCTKKRRSRRAFRNDSECIITTAGCVETAQSSLLRAEPELRPHICVQPVKRLKTIRYSQMVSTKQISDQIFKSRRHTYKH